MKHNLSRRALPKRVGTMFWLFTVSGPFGYLRGFSQSVYSMYSVSSQSIGALSLSASSVGCSLLGHRYRHPVFLYRLRILACYQAELRFLYQFFLFCQGSLVSGTFQDYFLYLSFECYVLIFKFLYMNSHFYNGNV